MNYKWRIQREWFAAYEYPFEPHTPMWAVYVPLRNRKPYLFSSWRQAIDFVTKGDHR